MRKTLLLVFVHGFKGGDDTFGTFPELLRALVSHGLPKVDVVAVQYPKFETRGELKDCVGRFREWLQNKVIDLEVANSSASPIIDPSVHTVLIGHSMGGIVAAETLLLVADEQPLPAARKSKSNLASSSSSSSSSNTTLDFTTGTSDPTTLHQREREGSEADGTGPRRGPTPMFPQIVGLLAFDTPFLGLSPGVIAHGAEGHYKTASSAYSAFSELGSAFGWGGGAAAASRSARAATSSPTSPKPPITSAGAKRSQPAGGLLTDGSNGNGDAAASPRWQSWGKYAMFAGAAGAVAAGGAAALYSQREKLTSGWGWISGHLEFVGCLLRGEELRDRVGKVSALAADSGLLGCGAAAEREKEGGRERDGADGKVVRGKGFRGGVVFYTTLGRGANTNTYNHGGNSGPRMVGVGVGNGNGEKRTFCKLPQNVERPAPVPGPRSVPDGGGIRGQPGEGLMWIPAVNDKATDEIAAHTSMFYPRNNPGFYGLGERAKEIVVGWIRQGGDGGEWYESSDGAGQARGKGKGKGEGKGAGSGVHEAEHVWVHGDEAEDQDDEVRMRDVSVDAEDLEGSVVVDKAA